jgi:hypothetical protein
MPLIYVILRWMLHYLFFTYNLLFFLVSLSLHPIDSIQTDEKLHAELQSGTTLEAKFK